MIKEKTFKRYRIIEEDVISDKFRLILLRIAPCRNQKVLVDGSANTGTLMKDNGKMAGTMDMEEKYTTKESIFKDNGRMTYRMDKASMLVNLEL